MSSFNRRFFITSTLALAGCGFTPAYAPDGAARALRNNMSMHEPDDRISYALYTALIDRFGAARDPRFHLDYATEASEEDVGITREGEITRYHIAGTAHYRLTEIASGRVLAEGDVQGFSAYSATRSTVASLTSTRDAYERLMRSLARNIETHLIAKLSQ
ncbi:LPS assembly lipoprotein LptE [Celeribacter arenosi]|uniref:LPS assembly lipoprotein LptE n=1 Tax=Celeribacter arenosi TaxID=792649 RepID=A0ABP7JYJ7_9RHOB